MSRRSSLQSTRHRTRKRTKVRSTYKTGECLQFSVCLQALSCFFCVPEKRPRCGGRASLDGVAARGLVNGAHRIQVIAWQSALLTGLRHGDHAHRYFRGISAWRRGLLSALRHGDPAYRQLSGIPTWRRGSSIGSSARPPCPQVPQWHPRVAKCSSDCPSAWRHCPQMPQWHPCGVTVSWCIG